jgi:hypothetical protein
MDRLTARLGGGAKQAVHTTHNSQTVDSAQKPKQYLNSKCNKGTNTTEMIANNIDVTRAKGKKIVTTGSA